MTLNFHIENVTTIFNNVFMEICILCNNAFKSKQNLKNSLGVRLVITNKSPRNLKKLQLH